MKMKYNLSEFVGCSENNVRGKVIVLNTYIRKEESSKTSNLSLHLRKPKKKSKLNPKQKKISNKN